MALSYSLTLKTDPDTKIVIISALVQTLWLDTEILQSGGTLSQSLEKFRTRAKLHIVAE